MIQQGQFKLGQLNGFGREIQYDTFNKEFETHLGYWKRGKKNGLVISQSRHTNRFNDKPLRSFWKDDDIEYQRLIETEVSYEEDRQRELNFDKYITRKTSQFIDWNKPHYISTI